jgi:hypothetical protein
VSVRKNGRSSQGQHSLYHNLYPMGTAVLQARPVGSVSQLAPAQQFHDGTQWHSYSSPACQLEQQLRSQETRYLTQ